VLLCSRPNGLHNWFCASLRPSVRPSVCSFVCLFVPFSTLLPLRRRLLHLLLRLQSLRVPRLSSLRHLCVWVGLGPSPASYPTIFHMRAIYDNVVAWPGGRGLGEQLLPPPDILGCQKIFLPENLSKMQKLYFGEIFGKNSNFEHS